MEHLKAAFHPTYSRPVVLLWCCYPPLVALFRPLKVYISTGRNHRGESQHSRVEVESEGGEGEERGEEENGERQIQQKRGEDGG